MALFTQTFWKTSNVSICLLFPYNELHPNHTSVSDHSYQYRFFKILLGHLLGGETSLRQGLARLVQQQQVVLSLAALSRALLMRRGGTAKERAHNSQLCNPKVQGVNSFGATFYQQGAGAIE